MAQLKTGSLLPEFRYDTPFENDLAIAHMVSKAEKTAIIFLRYYGCPTCQLDMHNISQNYNEIVGENGQIVVVLQSSVENLKKLITKDTFPFPIICDPQQELYKQFGIDRAASMVKMMDAKSVAKVLKATAKGIKHGAYEGEELQLPACFVVDKNLKLVHCHYGRSIGDVPTNEELKTLLK